jgi:DNA mismatch endonuclease Vsr
MSRVRSSGSAIEKLLAAALTEAGLRFKKQQPMFGRPDFVILKPRIAIFCDSEFWHGYRWGERRKAEHKTNTAYWFSKIERNRARDRLVNRLLRRDGWVVFRFWERAILSNAAACARKVVETYKSSGGRAEDAQAPPARSPRVDVGRSLSADRRTKSKTEVAKGRGDRRDVKR